MKIFEKIRLWWKFEGKYYHKDFVDGVKNLIRWFPVIWRDRDWDDHFVWELMIKKITFQAKYIGVRDSHTRAKRDVEIMMTCVRLMEKVRDEYYTTEYMDYHKTEYDFVDCDIPGSKELKTTELSERFDEYFSKYPSTLRKVVANPKAFQYIQEDYKDRKGTLAILIARENHDKARRILFTLMERNTECWWD